MGTGYDEIFSAFKDRITDPDLILFSDELQTEILVALMNNAISRCQRICNEVDLSDRDDETLTFNVTVPYDIKEIISEWMVVFWLKPYLNNQENLQNALSTKDFSFFSPANLLEKIGNAYKDAFRSVRSLTNEYSYVHADFSGLSS